MGGEGGDGGVAGGEGEDGGGGADGGSSGGGGWAFTSLLGDGFSIEAPVVVIATDPRFGHTKRRSCPSFCSDSARPMSTSE